MLLSEEDKDKSPTVNCGSTPPPLKQAVERVHATVPRSQVRYLDGQTHNLGAEAGAGMMREYFLGRGEVRVGREPRRMSNSHLPKRRTGRAPDGLPTQ